MNHYRSTLLTVLSCLNIISDESEYEYQNLYQTNYNQDWASNTHEAYQAPSFHQDKNDVYAGPDVSQSAKQNPWQY